MMLLQAIWSADTKQAGDGAMLRPFALAAVLLPFAGVTVGLTGCSSGVTSQLPSENSNVQARESTSRSWMKPTTRKDDLVYVSTDPLLRQARVEVYSWETHQEVGELRDAVRPRFLCSDKAGDVFVPDYDTNRIFEYAHGGTKPIAILQDIGHTPWSCGSDRVTGDVAVVDLDDIAIYGFVLRRYTDSHFAGYRFCGYDDKGNLFVDGVKPSGHFILAELPKGRTTFTEITLHPENLIPPKPGSVQWDGRYLAIGDDEHKRAIQFKITGFTGEYQGTVNLHGGDGLIHQFWIPKFGTVRPQATHIVGAQSFGFVHHEGDVGFWAYPRGGDPRHLIPYLDHPIGITVSIAK